jgi:hypothetical protein
MNKAVLAILFAVGLLAVAWIGMGFVGSNGVALLMTGVIGAVYVLGAWEVWRFRGVTVSLAAALVLMPMPLLVLSDWVGGLPHSIQHAVRSRIEGERTALPGLSLTPYLVGLLVMLGMLGTFLGMVVTFKGAVFALEGSTDLPTIRAALAEPIKGLGLSFGTSVAGVATSALLGMMSAVCRRERLAVVRELDARMATDFKPFTLAHQRNEAYQAMQVQAKALPDVVEALQTIVRQVDSRNQLMNEQMLARQTQFHADVERAYTHLASSVAQALNDSLSASARIAGDSLQPVVESAIARMALDAQTLHQQFRQSADAHLQGLAAQFNTTANQVSDTWTQALSQQTQAHDTLVTRLDGSLAHFNSSFDQRASVWLADTALAAERAQQAQQAADEARQTAWSVAMASWADALQQSWQQTGEQTLAQQQAICQTLSRTAADMTQNSIESDAQRIKSMESLLQNSEDLARARLEAETRWAAQHSDYLGQLTAAWHTAMNELRADETQRGQAAVDRLDALQTALGSQLATLGIALEAPMTRLMQTAAEVPQAAAGMMAELRQEMTRLTERDNLAFDERRDIMGQIGALLHTLNHASGEQRLAVESLVASATTVLAQAGEHFAQTLGAHVDKADNMAANVNATAIELASLGDAFNHGVQLFSASNEKLVEGLQRIEGAMKNATARSDEQLAYYVAQAREVIDLSIASQQGIVDDLRRLHANTVVTEAEATA